MAGSTLSSTISIGVTLDVSGFNSPFTITNTGEIDATYAYSGAIGADALFAGKSIGPAAVSNNGNIIGGIGYLAGGIGVYLAGQDRFSNAGNVRGGSSTGVGGGGAGVYLAADEGASMSNSGTIAGADAINAGGTGVAVGLTSNFYFHPGSFSVQSSLAAQLSNSGVILGGYGHTGAGGLHGDGGTGVFLGAGTVTNDGTIIGGSGTARGGAGVVVYEKFGATLINAGTIGGGAGFGGTMAPAVSFGGAGSVAATLEVEPGAVFVGDVLGAGAAGNVLELGPTGGQATLAGLGSQITGFDHIDFADGGSWLLSGTSAAFDAGQTISGFGADTLSLAGFTATSDSYVAGSGLVLSNGAVSETLDIAGNFSTGSFIVLDAAGGTEVELCFLRGTNISTPAGEVAIETLQIGDAVITRFNGYRRIKWIGRQSFGGRFVRNDRAQLPVRLLAGALGPQLPKRDLWVSPGHSMLIGGALVLARNLVNGITITQDDCPDEVHYLQLEFETHDCVRAEGCWSESFCDYAGLRNQFHNVAEFHGLYPEHVTPDEHLLCAPRPEAGRELEAALRPIVARAAAFAMPGLMHGRLDHRDAAGNVAGWAQDFANPELPVLLEVLLTGERVGSVLACDFRADLVAATGHGRCAFSVKTGALTKAAMASLTVRRVTDGAMLPSASDTGRRRRRAGA